MSLNQNSNKIDLIILFNGNHLAIPVAASDYNSVIDLLQNPKEKWASLDRSYFFKTNEVIGFYFRNHEKSPSEKMLQEIKEFKELAKKQIDDSESGN